MNILIEKKVRFPNQLSEAEKVEVLELLQHSQAAKKWHDWLFEFYANYDLIDKLARKEKEIKIKLFKPKPIQEPKNVSYGVKLAAQTIYSMKKHEFTILSEDDQLAIRVFKDELKNQFYLYLIQTVSKPKNYILRLIQSKKEYKFGPSACVAISSSDCNFSNLSASDIELIQL